MIECRNLRKVYRSGDLDTVALDNVSFGIERGDFVSIIGPSGSGKSTLMHILGALDVPTSGTYFFDGRDVSKLGDDALSELRKEKIGFVFQSFNLLPRTTVLRNVMLPLLYTDTTLEERTQRAREALFVAGMEEGKFLNLSNQLSGGQMQRVAIARALINRPSIIFADEPTGNLDTKTGHIVMEAFQRLHREGHTIVLITHEMEVANFASRILSVRDGRIESDTRI
ncbi:MAG: ABC transporter ATP-binding protein [Candidatus Moraniibacteriota bacterium]|nr:MAG: ABC transporter ATP-binding protein [Candidatus Moranbacteria bacterium]